MSASSHVHTHILIAGAGHAGGRVAQQLRAQGHTGPITLVGEEAHAPYERPALSKELLLGTRSAAELTLGPAEFWQSTNNQIKRIHAAVTKVDGERRLARLSNGDSLDFDVLTVATGGHARRLCVSGRELPQVHVLRTLDDSAALRDKLVAGKRLVVVGGGVIGMEAAASARALGVHVTVLEAGERIMARIVPPQGSTWLDTLHKQQGVAIRYRTQVTGIVPAKGGHEGVEVQAVDAEGRAFNVPADVVLVAIGITPATAFLEGSGVALNNGVCTDVCGRSTSAPWCFAVGDVACSDSPFYGRPLRQETWRNAENQAAAVAAAILGGSEPYVEIPWMWTDQFARNVQVVGIYSKEDEVVQRGDTLLWTNGGRVAGGMLIDSGRDRKPLEALVRRQAAIDAMRLADTSIALKALA
jgi:3-phenylpropionate/trans-cinnamate dioxygenase ferredoxin reductase subunit